MAKKTVIITGVTKGLGAAVAFHLLDRNYDVVGIGRNAAPELKHARFRLVTLDLADLERVEQVAGRLFAELADLEHERIALINNAAVAWPTATIDSISEKQLSASLHINLHAPTLLCAGFLHAFARKAGDRRIVNVSSGAAHGAMPGAGVYSMAKAGLEMLTDAICSEQGSSGVVVVSLRPGIIDTPMQDFLREQDPASFPSHAMVRDFKESGALWPADKTAAALVRGVLERPVEQGKTYNIDEF